MAQNNYYNLINGYKSVFLKGNSSENGLIETENYIDGCSFEEIYSLYTMDQELKNIIFKYLLRFEKIFKSYIKKNIIY